MGFDVQNTIFIFEAKKAGVDFTSCATLGRQNLHIDKSAVAREARRFGLESTSESIASAFSSFPFADGLLHLLGTKELTTIDASDYEGASVVADLNAPIAPTLRDRFSLIIDGGTIEHIFNVPCGFANVAAMLKVGGHFLSVNGANNFMGHGFYQFSPELLFRVFSLENGFEVESMILCEFTPDSDWYEVADPAKVRSRVELINNARTYLMMRARKVAEKTMFANPPQQSDYEGLVERIHETDQLECCPQYARLQHFRAVPYDSNFGSGRLEWQNSVSASGASELSFALETHRQQIKELLSPRIRAVVRRVRQATRPHFRSPFFSKVRTFF